MTAEGLPPPPRDPRRVGRSRQRTLRRVPIIILVAGCLVAAAVMESGRDDPAPAQGPAPVGGPTVPARDQLSAAWYCAEGTAQAEGRANETIVIANVGTATADAIVTVLPGSGENPGSRRVSVGEGEQVQVPVSEVLETAERPDPSGVGVLLGPGVLIEVRGGRAVVEHVIEGEDDYAVGACARETAREWYFAAGATDRGAEQHLALFNPFAGDAIVDVQFLSEEGSQRPADLQGLVVPRRSRITVPVHNYSRRHVRVATRVRASSGSIVAEQSNTFTEEHATRRGLTLSLGSTAPVREWTLPNVSGGPGALQSVHVANFAPTATEIEIAVRGAEGAVDPETVAVPAQGTVEVDLTPRLASSDPVAVLVRSLRTTPIVVEELAWFDDSTVQGVATVFGTPEVARSWVFALARLDPDSDALLSVFNPGRTPTRVRLVTYSGGGRTVLDEQEVDGVRPVYFDLFEQGLQPDQLVAVEADDPVVAGRLITGPVGRSLALGIRDPAG